MVIGSIDFNLIGSSLIWGIIILVIVKTLRNRHSGGSNANAAAIAAASSDATGGMAGAKAETGAINVYLVVGGNVPNGVGEITDGKGSFLVSPDDPAIRTILSRLNTENEVAAISEISSISDPAVVEFQ